MLIKKMIECDAADSIHLCRNRNKGGVSGDERGIVAGPSPITRGT